MVFNKIGKVWSSRYLWGSNRNLIINNMKKVLSVIALLAFVLGTANLVQAQSTSDNALIGRAHSEVGSCIGQAHPLNGQLGNQGNSTNGVQSEVSVIGSCFAGGFLKRVSFYYITFGPPCNPDLEAPCRPPLPIFNLIATVDFDCAGNIVASECY
jgi:hypothetical protein